MIPVPPPVVLQSCDPSRTGVDRVTDFEFIPAVTCVYFETAGLLLTGLLVWSAVAGSIYIRTGSAIIPFILLLLTGGAIMATVASIGIALATVTVLLVGGGVVAYGYHIFSQ